MSSVAVRSASVEPIDVPYYIHFFDFVLELAIPRVHLFGGGRVEKPRTVRSLQDWIRVRAAESLTVFVRFFVASVVKRVHYDCHPV